MRIPAEIRTARRKVARTEQFIKMECMLSRWESEPLGCFGIGYLLGLSGPVGAVLSSRVITYGHYFQSFGGWEG